MVSLDGHRIAIRKMQLKKDYSDRKVVVPGKTLNEISKILSGEMDDIVSIYFTNNHILFEFDQTMVVSRLIEGEYFRIDQMLSSDYETKLSINKKEFLDCIDRATLLVREGYKTLEDLPQGARIGTGSKRRKYQLLKHRPDLEIVPIRGNIETRIKKIETEKLDGVVLAASGLRRAGLDDKIDYYIPTDIMLPAPAQGILALEIREDDKETEKIIDSIKDDITKIQIDAERGFLIGVNGSCHIPMGAYCEIEGEKITLTGLYGDGEGKKIVVQSQVGTLADAPKIGYELAKSVLKEYEQ